MQEYLSADIIEGLSVLRSEQFSENWLRVKLEENCELQGTVNALEQI